MGRAVPHLPFRQQECQKDLALKLTELIAAGGGGQVTPRFVRFLISEGVIPPPTGGRAHADYGEAHLRGIVSYLRLRRLGFSLAQSKEIILTGREATLPVRLAPGLALHVDFAEFARDASLSDLVERFREAVATIRDALPHEGEDDAHAA